MTWLTPSAIAALQRTRLLTEHKVEDVTTETRDRATRAVPRRKFRRIVPLAKA